MKAIIILCSICTLLACSPTWHIQRAIKKDPSILKGQTDTIRISTKEVVLDTTFTDSVIVDNDRLTIRVVKLNGVMKLYYKLKEFEFDTIFHTHLIDVYDTLKLKKHRYEYRYEKEIKIREIKEKGKTDRLNIRKGALTSRQEEKTKRTVERRKGMRIRIIIWSLILILISCIAKWTKNKLRLL
jgi:hypothetical protein